MLNSVRAGFKPSADRGLVWSAHDVPSAQKLVVNNFHFPALSSAKTSQYPSAVNVVAAAASNGCPAYRAATEQTDIAATGTKTINDGFILLIL
jgi:hypothetical protein